MKLEANTACRTRKGYWARLCNRSGLEDVARELRRHMQLSATGKCAQKALFVCPVLWHGADDLELEGPTFCPAPAET